MDIGMLWFDGDKSREIEQRITRAVAYYRNKYGKSPNICVVNTTMMEDEQLGVMEGLEVRPSPLILPEHFWLGIETEGSGDG